MFSFIRYGGVQSIVRVIGLSIMGVLFSASFGLALDDDSIVGSTWPTAHLDRELTVPFCTAFASVPGKDRCLIGCFDGRLVSISLPDGAVREVAKFDHSVQSIACDGEDDMTAVVTYDKPSETTTVLLVPADGHDRIVIDRRRMRDIWSSDLQWSPRGDYLAVLF